MGCDIHLYIEFRHKPRPGEEPVPVHLVTPAGMEIIRPRPWASWGSRLYMGRDYDWFGFLAGVRTGGPPVVEPRGMPMDLGWEALGDCTMAVRKPGDDCNCAGTVSLANAQKYVANRYSQWYEEPDPEEMPDIVSDDRGCILHRKKYGRVTHPDWHSATWLTVPEFEKSLRLVKGGDITCQAALAVLKTLAKATAWDVRAVIWFDN